MAASLVLAATCTAVLLSVLAADDDPAPAFVLVGTRIAPHPVRAQRRLEDGVGARSGIEVEQVDALHPRAVGVLEKDAGKHRVARRPIAPNEELTRPVLLREDREAPAGGRAIDVDSPILVETGVRREEQQRLGAVDRLVQVQRVRVDHTGDLALRPHVLAAVVPNRVDRAAGHVAEHAPEHVRGVVPGRQERAVDGHGPEVLVLHAEVTERQSELIVALLVRHDHRERTIECAVREQDAREPTRLPARGGVAKRIREGTVDEQRVAGLGTDADVDVDRRRVGHAHGLRAATDVELELEIDVRRDAVAATGTGDRLGALLQAAAGEREAQGREEQAGTDEILHGYVSPVLTARSGRVWNMGRRTVVL